MWYIYLSALLLCVVLYNHSVTTTVCLYTSVISHFQLTSWFEELKSELASSEVADTVEGAQELLGQFNQQKEATIDASINTISEGENLLDQLR